MKIWFTFTLIIAMLAANSVALDSPKMTYFSEISDEEYSVYSAVISSMFAGGKVTFDTQADVKLLVIKDRTIVDSSFARMESKDWKYLKENFPKVLQKTLDDFGAKNKDTHQLKDRFKTEFKRNLIIKDEIEQTFKDRADGWEKFYKNFPGSGGYVEFSRVGFDSEKKQALWYMSSIAAAGYVQAGIMCYSKRKKRAGKY